MNGGEDANLETKVFVNHGWASCHLFETLSVSKVYRTYCKMEERTAGRWEGDCLVLDGDRAVAFFGGINLQGVPRRVLDYLLLNEDIGKSTFPANEPPSNPTQRTLQDVQPRVALTAIAPTSAHHIPAQASGASGASVAEAKTTRPILQPKNNQNVQLILQIMSEETGIPIAELIGAGNFAVLGIDSLLTLQIASRLNETGINIEPSRLSHMKTIDDLDKFINSERPMLEMAFGDIIEGSNTTAKPQIATSAHPAQINMNILRRSPIKSDGLVEPLGTAAATRGPSEPKVEKSYHLHDDKVLARALEIISEESGVGMDELADNAVFTELGVDSLLSLMVLARYREELKLVIAFDARLFIEYPTVGDLKNFLASSSGARMPTVTTHSTSPSSASSEPTHATWESTEESSDVSSAILKPEAGVVPVPVHPLVRAVHTTSSVILQGRPRADPRTLFLFPDGSGCAASYTGMASVRPGLAIIGLNSPYFRHPTEMGGLTLDALMEMYLGEVRRRQPSGPYSLGGWSSGGILAFRAAQILIQEGEQVDSLLLIDAPPPTGLDPLPERWYEQCTMSGVFSGMTGCSASRGTTPSTVIPHFRAVVQMLQAYHADPLPQGFTPRTSIVWADRCVFDGRPGYPLFEMRAEDPEGIKFLTRQRTDWTAGEWTQLFPLDEPAVSIMEDQDHFSMMRSENGEQLARFISDATL
ncbi:Alpha/Beta hydrolase protein [Ustulina deusta]|nr:Alpha/Beta hydrolase protein [Ustulina deusta]